MRYTTADISECPLGTLLEWCRFGAADRRQRRLPRSLRGGKYLVLTALLAMAALGSLTLMVLDPLSLLTRTATTTLIPMLAHAVDELDHSTPYKHDAGA